MEAEIWVARGKGGYTGYVTIFTCEERPMEYPIQDSVSTYWGRIGCKSESICLEIAEAMGIAVGVGECKRFRLTAEPVLEADQEEALQKLEEQWNNEN